MVDFCAVQGEIIGEKVLVDVPQIIQCSGDGQSRLYPRCARINQRWGVWCEGDSVDEDQGLVGGL